MQYWKTFLNKAQAFIYRTPADAASRFSRQLLFSVINLLFVGDIRIGFCPRLLWKHELNLRRNQCSCSVKKNILRNFANFIGKHLCWSLFLRWLVGLKLIQLEQQINTQFLFIILAKKLKPMLCKVIKGT